MRVQCNVHNSMYFPKIVMRAIDTQAFQRLRDLQQTGFLYRLYPTARHSRFEHSLGVAWNCRRIMMSLRARQPELGINDRHVDMLTLAGLVHDLGHGPMSHLYEDGIAKETMGSKFSHELMSAQLYRTYIAPAIRGCSLADADIDFIPVILAGDTGAVQGYFGGKLGFMARLITDKTCGADMDRLDYLKRDAMAMGIPVHFDLDKIIETAQVVDAELVWPIKEAYNLDAMFQTRYELFLRAYRHRTVEAIDLMVMDAFELDYAAKSTRANRLAHHWADLSEFVQFTDSMVTSPPPGSWMARTITQINHRKLYTCLTEVPIPDDADAADIREKVQAIFGPGATSPVKVTLCRIHYGMGDADPFAKMKFVDDCGELVSWSPTAASMLIRPVRFSQTSIRVFVKTKDPAVIADTVKRLKTYPTLDMEPVGRSKHWNVKL